MNGVGIDAMIELAKLAAADAIQATVRVVVDAYVGEHKDKAGRARLVSELEGRLLRSVDRSALGTAMQEALGWASEIHVQGMHQPVDTQTASIPLTFATAVRRFRGLGNVGSVLDERALVKSEPSYLVLGDPGSGKTTTLKRLTLSLFEEPDIDEIEGAPAVPVALVCRQIDWTATDLPAEIISRIGLDPARVADDLDLSGHRALPLAAALLEGAKCLLLVDGLDEITDRDLRGRLLSSLSRLRRMTSARIICSCRSGDAPHLEGFSVVELLPLTPTQIHAIVEARTADADEFLARVRAAGIDDELLDRPLFLNQLLTVYDITGNLPDRPVDLYRHLVRLLLHDWDVERSVQRRSQYAEFDGDTKREFLSEIAFRLTIDGRATFDESTLLDIFADIHEQFGLPKREAIEVAREIESHVGIIAEIANGFQFTHYTMQEYLCAENISRRPLNAEVARYLRTMPAVVAVAVALSSSPTTWLIQCLDLSRQFNPPRLASEFASRLGIERPRFKPTMELGVTLLHLMSQADGADAPDWRRLGQVPSVRDALDLTKGRFEFARDGSYVTYTRRTADPDSSRRHVAFGKVAAPVFDLFMEL